MWYRSAGLHLCQRRPSAGMETGQDVVVSVSPRESHSWASKWRINGPGRNQEMPSCQWPQCQWPKCHWTPQLSLLTLIAPVWINGKGMQNLNICCFSFSDFCRSRPQLYKYCSRIFRDLVCGINITKRSNFKSFDSTETIKTHDCWHSVDHPHLQHNNSTFF